MRRRRRGIGLVVALACLGAFGITMAQAAVPAPVSSAVNRFVSKTKEIQNSQIAPTAEQAGRAAGAAVGPCEQHPEARGPLESAINELAGGMHGYVVASEEGELGLYKLAPRLGAKHSAARTAFVDALDDVGKVMDSELDQVADIRKAASKFGSGDCSGAANQVSNATALIAFARSTLDRDLAKLQAKFG
jgi:hypothetical protein